MNSEARVIAAFDFGLKHIGMAIGQEITNTAQTFYSLKAELGQPNWDELDVIVRDWQPKLFIVGNPINMDGTFGSSSQSINDVSKNILKNIDIPLCLWDERLSTVAAFNLSSQLDVNVSKKVKNIDKNAAAFILQGAIDCLKN